MRFKQSITCAGLVGCSPNSRRECRLQGRKRTLRRRWRVQGRQGRRLAVAGAARISRLSYRTCAFLHLLLSCKQDINCFALLLSATSRLTSELRQRRPRVTPHGGPRAGSGAAEALTGLPARRLRRWCLVAESSSQVPSEPSVMYSIVSHVKMAKECSCRPF